MYTKSIFAVSGALLSLVAAVPMNKREVVWITETQEDVVTVPVITTVWLNPGEEAPAATTTSEHYGHHHKSKSTAIVHSTVTVHPVEETSSTAPAPASYEAPTTSSTSTYVAPTTTSSSEYVAPAPSTYEAPATSSTSEYVAPTTASTSEYVAPVPSTYEAPTTSSTSEYVAPTTASTSEYVPPTTASTSEYVAPTTYAAPTTTSTWEAPSSTYVAPTTAVSSAPAATATYSSGSGESSGMGASGTSYTGDLTYYDVGLGSCGLTNVASDHVVAISHVIFDSYGTANPNNNPLCGKYVSITGSSGEKYQAKIVDRCVGCLAEDLDLSTDFFKIVEPTGNGRVHDVSWSFV